MCDAMEQIYPNPWNKRLFKTAVLLCIICVFGSGLMMFVITDNIIILIIASLLGLLGIMSAWYIEYYRKSDQVTITSDWVELHFRSMKPKRFRWSELVAVYSNPTDHSLFSQESQGSGGGLLFRTDEPFQVSYRIASAVQEAYKASTGTYPPKWDGYENFKKLRKRIMRSRVDQDS